MVGTSVVVVVVVVVALVSVLTRSDHSERGPGGPGAAGLALARLDANDGRAYVGAIGDMTDAVRLRRTLRAELRSHTPRPRGRDASKDVHRCATGLRRASRPQRGTVVFLADATQSGMPVVVVGITDRGRVVAFVADADTCEIRGAQSL
jgi:hypothetical protein